MVVLKDLSIGYKTKKDVKVVAEGLSGAICSGQLTCLLGENGVGKSTLLRTLSGFQPKLGAASCSTGATCRRSPINRWHAPLAWCSPRNPTWDR